MEKEFWPSRTSFVLAAIGSAIGLGNVWRFPYTCVNYGGGAFLIPYLVALFTAGIPLMVLELGLGHKTGASAPLAFGATGRGREWLGWLAVGVGFMIISYYAVIMGWCANYFRYSFNLAWGANTEDFFYNHFLNKSDNMKDVFSINPAVLAGLVLSWILITLCIWKGARSVGRVVYLTVPLPWICLVLFVIKGLSLPGAEQGIAYYLTPNFAALRDSSVWLAAYSQIFFSLSIGFGVMIAYASFLPKRSDIVNNAFIISLANCGTSFLGGFAVFATLGHYAHQMGLDMPSFLAAHPDKAKTFGLVFLTYPTIISQLGRVASFFGAVFFIMLMTLAIDSAFSLVEAGAASFIDKYNTKRLKANFGIAIVAVAVGYVFTTRAGYYWLDVVDYFMNSFCLAAVGLIECIVIAYFYGTRNIRDYVNSISELSVGKWWDGMIMFVTPVILSISIGLEIKARILGSYEGVARWVEFTGGWSLVIALPVISMLLMRSRTRRPV